MPEYLNIAAYQFATLSDLKSWREQLLHCSKKEGLRGTILLSTEGINLFVAGSTPGIEALLALIRTIPGLQSLTPKYSKSDHQPFTRMLVRIKKEIIAFGVPGIDPSVRTSPKLAPTELKRWLDEKRPITLLDTRNGYEVKLGTFRGAIHLGLDHFRHFPAAAKQLPETLKQQPIVMYCTGGIRCEKAGPYLEREGFQQVYQLDGGILKYFEECQGEHYDGECFVFDQRVGVDPGLRETESTQCHVCLTPLSAEDQADPRYVVTQSCPNCFRTSAEAMAAKLVEREEHWRQITDPLPGLQPYSNERPIHIGAAYDGWPLVRFLETVFPHLPSEHWRDSFESGRLLNHAGLPVTIDQKIRGGDRYRHVQPQTTEPAVSTAIRWIYEDEAIVVLDKPAPLPMHPCGRFNRHTLQYFLDQMYGQQRLRSAHRLDANTTGLVAYSRTKHFARRLQPQFESGDVEKFYLARVRGHPQEAEFSCDLPISDSPSKLGARAIDRLGGLPALTHFRVIERKPDGTSLLEVRPMTGRTNQIRVHLSHLDYPLVGDATYRGEGQLGDVQTVGVEAKPIGLHAWKLAFWHPMGRQRMSFTSKPPDWAQ